MLGRKQGAKNMENTKAFTLIELLVVVLIIGILAAVALPQYQKAVEKSKAAQALTLLKSVGQAAEIYAMANGSEFRSFDDLSVEIPWATGTRVIGGAQNTRSNAEWALEVEDSSSSGYTMLFITRISGKYQGAGFLLGLHGPTGHIGGAVVPGCFERKTGATKTFDSSLPAGAYCAQIMKGSLSSEDTWERNYTLP